MISGEKGTGMSARFVILIPRLVCQVTSFKSDTEVTFQFSVHQFDAERFPAWKNVIWLEQLFLSKKVLENRDYHSSIFLPKHDFSRGPLEVINQKSKAGHLPGCWNQCTGTQNLQLRKTYMNKTGQKNWRLFCDQTNLVFFTEHSRND